MMNNRQYNHDLLDLKRRTGVTESLVSLIGLGLAYIGIGGSQRSLYMEIVEEEIIPPLSRREEALAIDMTALPTKLLQELMMRLGDDDAGSRRGPSLIEECPTEVLARIASKSPRELLAEWSGWTLGDPSWAGTFLGNYEKLEAAMVRPYDMLTEKEDKVG